MDLTPAQLAWLRNAVLTARKQGMSDPEIDAQLQQSVHVSLADVARMTPLDVGRSLTEGATLGHSDELGAVLKMLRGPLGAVSALTTGRVSLDPGRGYAATRDSLRDQAHASSGMNPGKTALLEVGGGMLPAMAISAIPGGAAPAAAGWLPKAAAAATVAGLGGALLGEGKSEAPDMAGVATDAGKAGLASALLGGGLSALGSAGGAAIEKVKDFRDPAGAAMRRAAPLMPNNAPEIAAQQEAMAPGTVVPADMSRGMTSSVAGVGADAATGVQATEAAEARVVALKKAKQLIGQQYEQFKQPVPVTKELRTLLASVGKSKLLPADATVAQREVASVLGEWAAPGVKQIDAAAVFNIRKAILDKARAAGMTGKMARAHDLREMAGKITDYLEPFVPEIRQLDQQHAFISSRLTAAQKTLKQVVQSLESHTKQSVGSAGAEAASAGGQIPKSHTTFADMLMKLVTPTRATTAAGANEALLTPVGPDYLQKMLRMKQLLGAPPGPAANIMRASLFGDAAPQAAQFGSQFFPEQP